MSVFSDKLNAIILKKHLSLPELAESSGLTTALISKIKTGKRLPESEEKILDLIHSLHCTPEQEADLIREYRIEKIGRDRYMCMCECHKCLEALMVQPPCLLFEPKLMNIPLPLKQCVTGEINITAHLNYMINYEVKQPKGHLRTSILPAFRLGGVHFLNALSTISTHMMQIEQLIPMHTIDSFSDEDNIHFTRYCLHFASLFGDMYQAFYYYKTEFSLDFFPFCVLTTHHALLVSADYQTALFFDDSDTLTAMHHIFDAALKRCHPLLRMNGTSRSYMECYESIFTQLKGAPLETLQLSFEPNLLSIIPPHIASNHIHPSQLNSYTHCFLTHYWQEVTYAHIKTIFSLDGLDLFMETGICYELPYESQTPFTPSERKLILTIFLKKCDSKQIVPILLKDDILKLAPELSLKTLNKQSVLFIWNPVHKTSSSCTLEELTVKKNFSYFMEYIQTAPEYTYSPEESLAILHGYGEKYLE